MSHVRRPWTKSGLIASYSVVAWHGIAEVLPSGKDIVDSALGVGVAPLEDASTQEGLLHLYDSLIASTDVIDSFGTFWLKSFMEAERERGSPPGWNSVGLTGKLESFMMPVSQRFWTVGCTVDCRLLGTLSYSVPTQEFIRRPISGACWSFHQAHKRATASCSML